MAWQWVRLNDDSDGDPETGSVVATIHYDSLGRRIVNSGDYGSTGDELAQFHCYYTHRPGCGQGGQRLIESRDGSDYVLKQVL